jgi:hypothetical protein
MTPTIELLAENQLLRERIAELELLVKAYTMSMEKAIEGAKQNVIRITELEKWKECAKQLAWNAPSVAKLVGLAWDDKDKTWVIEKEESMIGEFRGSAGIIETGEPKP